MSIWTHVAGVIRVDAFIDMEPPDVGIPCSFDDDVEQWDKCNIPCGSEGSLKISTWENPSKSSLAKYTVAIFGDLRDYDNGQEIIDYFNRVTKNKLIRQASFTFCIENNKHRMFIWKNETFIEVF